jgi:hypothetical protein
MDARRSTTLYTAAATADRRTRAREFLESQSPLTETVVVSATREAADDFAREWTLRRGACFGLHRFGVMQLASRIAGPELARRGLSPMTALGSEAVAARAVFDALQRQELRYFAPVARTRGFAGSLASTLADLRLAGVTADNLDGSTAALADLHTLLRRHAALLDGGRLADRARLLEIAVDTLRRGNEAFPAGLPLVWLDAPLFTRAEQDFVAALCDAAASTLITLPAGDARSILAAQASGARPEKTDQATPRPAAPLDRLREHLFSDAPWTSIAGGDAVQFFSAPGEGRECVEIARLVLDEARRGVPFDRIGIALRSPETYTGLLRAALSRGEIPAWFSRGTSMPDPAGRAFLALLACASERLSAHRFAEYLSLGQVPDLDETGAPPAVPSAWTVGADEEIGRASWRERAAQRE